MSDKKKSNGWRSLFVKEDEQEDTPPDETKVVDNTTNVIKTPVVFNHSAVQNTDSSALFETKLKEAINNQSSEYVKFKKAVRDLESVLSDETTRIKTTFVSMRAMGITKETLVSAAKASHNIVSREQAEFENAMKAAYVSQVDGASGRINSLSSQIETKLAQISSLQNEVNGMKSEKDKLSSSIEQSKFSIDTARRDFSTAYNKVCEEINSDINKINSNL